MIDDFDGFGRRKLASEWLTLHKVCCKKRCTRVVRKKRQWPSITSRWCKGRGQNEFALLFAQREEKGRVKSVMWLARQMPVKSKLEAEEKKRKVVCRCEPLCLYNGEGTVSCAREVKLFLFVSFGWMFHLRLCEHDTLVQLCVLVVSCEGSIWSRK